MFFKKTEVQTLIAADDKDRKGLEAACDEKARLMPVWTAVQEECEHQAAAIQAHGATYRRGVDEEAWRARPQILADQARAAMVRRDAIFEDLNAEIDTLKQRLHQRSDLFISSFSRWAQRAQGSRPETDPIYQTLQAARKQLEQMRGGRLGPIIEQINATVEFLEETPDVDIPILRISDLCRQCAALNPEAVSAA